jgi:hypothetical protein
MIKTRDLRKAYTTSAPLEHLTGGRLARAHRVHAAHVQADNLLGNGRNVVARVGLHGSSAFQVTSVDPTSASQVYPLRTVSRTSCRTPSFALLPGHFLRVSALVVPSGMTNKLPGGGAWLADIPYGRIDVTITWTGSPGSVVTTHQMQLPTSPLTWAAEDTADGAAWSGLRRLEIPIMFPESVTTSSADLRGWCEGAAAEVVIAYRGGVRAVDVVVQQVPLGYARDGAVDTVYSSALVTNGAGATVQAYPVAYPVEERSATDPTYGAALLADLADRQHALGPVLVHWTAWDESTTTFSTTTPPSVSASSTTFVDMLRTSIAAWKSGNAGWSLSAGSQAQQFRTSNAHRETRGKNGCVPVRCWAYCARSVGGDATLRFQSENYSVAELTFSSSTPAWRSCTGHLRTGAHPEDPSVLQVLGKCAGVATIDLYAFAVEYIDF